MRITERASKDLCPAVDGDRLRVMMMMTGLKYPSAPADFKNQISLLKE